MFGKAGTHNDFAPYPAHAIRVTSTFDAHADECHAAREPPQSSRYQEVFRVTGRIEQTCARRSLAQVQRLCLVVADCFLLQELVEFCCKTILGKLAVDIGKSDDMNDLAKKLAKQLGPAPEGIDDQVNCVDCINRFLSDLNQMAGNLTNLRRLFGTGPGKNGRHRSLQSRHARLTVAAAVVPVDFVTATDAERKNPKSGESMNG